MSLELAILGFLSEHPRTGYDLKTRCFEGPLRAFWTADQAQIYRTLQRLKNTGLVHARRRRQSSRPDQLVYEITPAGLDSLHSQLATPTPLPPLRDSYLVQLHFAAHLDDDALLHVMSQRRAEHQRRLDGLRSHTSSLAASTSSSARTAVMQRTSVDGAISQQRAAIDWLDECIDGVAAGRLPDAGVTTGKRHLFGI